MTVLFNGEDVTWIVWTLIGLWSIAGILKTYARIQRKRLKIAEKKFQLKCLTLERKRTNEEETKT